MFELQDDCEPKKKKIETTEHDQRSISKIRKHNSILTRSLVGQLSDPTRYSFIKILK